ncbi:NAD-specific glutamate dehydrogenase-domain-containing protein, partial [Boletus coccyginus]
ITSSCKDFKDTIVDGDEGDVKGTTSMTTKVIDDSNHLEFATLLVQIISDDSGSGLINKLINNTEGLKTRNGTGVLDHLTLSVIEVQQFKVRTFSPRYISSLLHLCQSHGADLL